MHRFACVLLLAAFAGCAKVDVEAEKTALMTADREWSQTTKDLDKFMSYVASDATAYAPGAPAATGTDAIRKTWGEMLVRSWGLAFLDGVESRRRRGRRYRLHRRDLRGVVARRRRKRASTSRTGRRSMARGRSSDDIFNADAAPASAAGPHVMLAPGELKWGDGPPSLPPGAKMAVVQGDPTQAQPFVRARAGARPVTRCRRTGTRASRTSRSFPGASRSAWATRSTRAR